MTKRLVGALVLAMAASGLAVGCGGEKLKEGDKPMGDVDAIGIAECDDYLTKAAECSTRQSPEMKPAWDQAIKSSRESWKKNAAVTATRDTTKLSCKTALDSLSNNPICK